MDPKETGRINVKKVTRTDKAFYIEHGQVQCLCLLSYGSDFEAVTLR